MKAGSWTEEVQINAHNESKRQNVAVCCCQFASRLLPFPDGQSACVCLEMSYSTDLFLQEQSGSDFCGGRKQGTE